MVDNADQKKESVKPPPIPADTLRDPLTSNALGAKKADGASKEMSGGGDFSRLGEKLPL